MRLENAGNYPPSDTITPSSTVHVKISNLADVRMFICFYTKCSFLFKAAYKFSVGRNVGEVRRTYKGLMQCMKNFVNTSWL
jgi:hypothetical protein